MGWPWSPSPPSSSPSPPSHISSSSPAASSPPPSLTHDDPEVQKFLDLIASDSTSSSTSNSSSTTSSNPPSTSAISIFLSSKLSSPPPPPPPPPLSPLSESLLPSEMSCRQAFDLAWSCNSLAGQWNAVYRHGSMRSCSHHWDAFWLCMRTKSYSQPVREAAVREHYRRIEHEKYYAPGRRSSEDVWEARTEKLGPGAAFAQEMDLPRLDDDAWRREEEERRRGIRKQLGFDKT